MDLITNLREKESRNGITLIALVITIIILLILAGISIAMLTGDNGILKKAGNAKDRTIEEQIKEDIEIAIMEIQIEERQRGKKVTLESLAEGKLQEKLEEITVELSNNEITGEYKDYYYKIDENLNITIEEPVKGISFKCLYKPEEYSNGNIILTVNAKSTNGSITNIEITGLTRNEDGTFTITENKEYEITVTDSTGDSKTATINIQKIDTVNPKNLIVKTEGVNLDTFTIVATAEDGEATEQSVQSGIERYEYNIKAEGETEYKTYESKDGRCVINKLTPKTKYIFYVKVYDKAQNYITSENMEITTLETVLPPSARITFNEQNATKQVLDYPILTLEGMMNCSLDPNVGETVTLEITTPTTEDIGHKYSLDGGNTWNEYVNPVTTDYKGQDLIQVKSSYKGVIESEIKIVKKYIKDLTLSSPNGDAFKNEILDNDFSTAQILMGADRFFRVDPECWNDYISIYCVTNQPVYGYLHLNNEKNNKILINGYLTKLTTNKNPQMKCTRSVQIPIGAYWGSMASGTSNSGVHFSIYEIWCSKQNLTDTVYE